MKLAIVEWQDAWAMSKWQNIPAPNDVGDVPCISVGWVVSKDKTQILLAGTLANPMDPADRQMNQAMAIPLGFVKKVTYVGSKYTIKS